MTTTTAAPVAVRDSSAVFVPDSARSVLAAARDRRRTANVAEAELLALAVQWAVLHPAESVEESETHTLHGFGQTDLAIAGPGAPTVAEFSVAEFATAIGLSTEAGKSYVGAAVELRYRCVRRRTVGGSTEDRGPRNGRDPATTRCSSC
jgi:hypothetical protein